MTSAANQVRVFQARQGNRRRAHEGLADRPQHDRDEEDPERHPLVRRDPPEPPRLAGGHDGGVRGAADLQPVQRVGDQRHGDDAEGSGHDRGQQPAGSSVVPRPVRF